MAMERVAKYVPLEGDMLMALPVVYSVWCNVNNQNPLMHDPLAPEFLALAAKLVEVVQVARKDKPDAEA